MGKALDAGAWWYGDDIYNAPKKEERVEAWEHQGKWYKVIDQEMRDTGTGSHQYEWENWMTLERKEGTRFEVNTGWGSPLWIPVDRLA